MCSQYPKLLKHHHWTKKNWELKYVWVQELLNTSSKFTFVSLWHIQTDCNVSAAMHCNLKFKIGRRNRQRGREISPVFLWWIWLIPGYHALCNMAWRDFHFPVYDRSIFRRALHYGCSSHLLPPNFIMVSVKKNPVGTGLLSIIDSHAGNLRNVFKWETQRSNATYFGRFSLPKRKKRKNWKIISRKQNCTAQQNKSSMR